MDPYLSKSSETETLPPHYSSEDGDVSMSINGREPFPLAHDQPRAELGQQSTRQREFTGHLYFRLWFSMPLDTRGVLFVVYHVLISEVFLINLRISELGGRHTGPPSW